MEGCHGIRPHRQERHDRRWFRTAALSRRRRRQGWQDRRDRAYRLDCEGNPRCRGPRRNAGLHRWPHPHGRPDLLGSDRHQLLLPGRDQRRDGQLRFHARALPRERGRPGVPQPRTRRGHQPRGHAGRHRVALGNLPAVPRRARHAAQGHQLRGLHWPLCAAHLRHGPARLHRRGDRGRHQGDGASGEGSDRRRRHRLLDHAQRQSPDFRRQAGREPPRHVAGVRDAGEGDGRRPGRSRG